MNFLRGQGRPAHALRLSTALAGTEEDLAYHTDFLTHLGQPVTWRGLARGYVDRIDVVDGRLRSEPTPRARPLF